MRHHLALLAAAAAFAAPGAALAQEATAQAGAVTMSRAIEVAQGRIDGGVLEAELETEGGAEVYEIDIVRGSDIHEVSVDARTGEIVSETEQRLDSFVSGIFQDDALSAAEAARATLVGALAGLERDGARIEELDLDEEDDRWLYEVEMEDASGGREIWIDAATGEIVEDE